MSGHSHRLSYFDDVPMAESIYLMEDPYRDPYMPYEVTTSELRGYYAYAFGSLPFKTLLSASLLPFLLDEWLLNEGRELVTSLAKKVTSLECQFESLGNCTIKIGNGSVSLILFTLALWCCTLALQLVLTLWLGTLADFGLYRRFMLIVLGVNISLISMAVMVINDNKKLMWFGVALVVLARAGYAAVKVYRYGYIHTLTVNHPRAKRASHILPNSEKIYHQVVERVATTISSIDLMVGHLGTILSGSLCLIALHFYPGIEGLKISSCIIGAWYFLTTLISSKWLPSRVFKPAPRQFTTTGFLLKRLSQSFWFIWHLRRTNLLAICFALVELATNSYRLVTLWTFNSLYDITYFHWAAVLLTSSGGAIVGLWLLSFIAIRMKARVKFVLVLLHLLYLFLPLALYLMRISSFKSNKGPTFRLDRLSPEEMAAMESLNDFSGISPNWHLFLLSFLEGFIYANLESFYRIHYIEFLPPSREHEFFAHYTNLSTLAEALSGPFCVAIFLVSESIHFSLLVPVPFLFLAMMILLFLDAEKAKWANMEFTKLTI